MDGRRLGEVAWIAVFSGNGHDLAAKLEHRSGAVWREGGIADVAVAAGVAGPGFVQVGGDADSDSRRTRRCRVELVEVAGLLVHDLPGSRRHVDDGKILMLRDLAYRFCGRVERE